MEEEEVVVVSPTQVEALVEFEEVNFQIEEEETPVNDSTCEVEVVVAMVIISSSRYKRLISLKKTGQSCHMKNTDGTGNKANC